MRAENSETGANRSRMETNTLYDMSRKRKGCLRRRRDGQFYHPAGAGKSLSKEQGRLYLPKLSLCGDNGCMIGWANMSTWPASGAI